MSLIVRCLAVAALSLASWVGAEPLLDNGRVFINARVAGVPTEALLDSAAEATVLDRPSLVTYGISMHSS